MNSNGRQSSNAPPSVPVPDAALAEVAATEGPMATGERFRPIALAGLTVILIGLCVLLAFPFLSALAWAVALTIIGWPLHNWVRRQIAKPSRAALATTLIMLVAIMVPGLFLGYQLASEATSATEHMKGQSIESTLRGRMAQVPALQGTMAWMERANIDLDGEIRKLIGAYVSSSSGLLQGSGVAVIHFAIMLYILYHFLKDGPLLRQRVRTLLPMTRAECDRVFKSAADSVHANVYATLVTSLIDGVSGGLLFWALGLPSPALWGAVIFVVSILPILGTFIVWVPAAAFLMLTNDWVGALLLTIWGVGTAIIIDSLLFARLAGNRMRLHPVPVLLAFLGGLALFGPAGMILGPAILAITVAVLDVWHCRAEAADQLTAAESLSPSGQTTAEASAAPTNGAAKSDNKPREKAKR